MNHFTAEDADQINAILKDCKNCYAHKASFDKKVLEYEFEGVGKEFFPYRNLSCTQAMAKDRDLP